MDQLSDTPKIIKSISYQPKIQMFSVIIVELGRSGTHDNYNIIYNSICEKKYFDTHKSAQEFIDKYICQEEK